MIKGFVSLYFFAFKKPLKFHEKGKSGVKIPKICFSKNCKVPKRLSNRLIYHNSTHKRVERLNSNYWKNKLIKLTYNCSSPFSFLLKQFNLLDFNWKEFFLFFLFLQIQSVLDLLNKLFFSKIFLFSIFNHFANIKHRKENCFYLFLIPQNWQYAINNALVIYR